MGFHCSGCDLQSSVPQFREYDYCPSCGKKIEDDEYDRVFEGTIEEFADAVDEYFIENEEVREPWDTISVTPRDPDNAVSGFLATRLGELGYEWSGARTDHRNAPVAMFGRLFTTTVRVENSPVPGEGVMLVEDPPEDEDTEHEDETDD